MNEFAKNVGVSSLRSGFSSWNRTTEIHSAQILSRRKHVLRLGGSVAQAWAQRGLIFVRPLLCTGRIGILRTAKVCANDAGVRRTRPEQALHTRAVFSTFSICDVSE